ncbi:MAG: hypothetical protein IT352_06910 [Gemmatimonadales bacterium]|nr:hypothetical protein [Gemmatimonadales bacterium]
MQVTRARMGRGGRDLIAVGVAVAAMLIAGCDAQDPAGPEDPCDAAMAIRPSGSFLGSAAESDIAARVIPGGFGGMYHQADGDRFAAGLIVRLKDMSKATQAGAALRRLLSCGGAFPGWNDVIVSPSEIHAQEAQFTATELYEATRALEPLRSDPDVWGIEFDPEANRVWIGILQAAASVRIEAAVTGLGVAAEKVLIEPPPPAGGVESFAVKDEEVSTSAEPGAPLGVMFFSLRVSYTNLQGAVRYPDWCVSPDPEVLTPFFLFAIERWERGTWRVAYHPICTAVLLEPRTIQPGQVVTDSVPVPAVRRLGAAPIWRTPRVSGTYRFVGTVYRSRTVTPPFVADPAAANERVSAPFRVRHTLPF